MNNLAVNRRNMLKYNAFRTCLSHSKVCTMAVALAIGDGRMVAWSNDCMAEYSLVWVLALGRWVTGIAELHLIPNHISYQE